MPSLIFGVCVCQALSIGSDAWPARGIQSRPDRLLSSTIYSIYYSRYSTPYLSGEERRGTGVGGSCVERIRDVVIRRYRTTGIYTFGKALLSQLYSVT